MEFDELVGELDFVFRQLAAGDAHVPLSGIIFLSLLADRVVIEDPDTDANTVRKIMAVAVGFAQSEAYALDHAGLDDAVVRVKHNFRNCKETDPPDCWTAVLGQWDYFTAEFPNINHLADQLNIEEPPLSYHGRESELEW